MSFLNNLNENQMKAVMSTARYLRIIAGAGSGKTRVLIARIAHLIFDLGIHPGSILAITFTNKAANEMKERLNHMLASNASGVHISTIHSLCVMMLRQDATAIDLPRNFTVLDQDDQKSIIKEAYKEIGLDRQKYSIPSMLDYIGNNKGAEITVERAFTLAGSHYGEQEKAKVYAYYVSRQKALFALDFDDLLLETVRMFGLNPDILRKWQRRFNFIHVDEFQDIDRVQYKLIKQLAGKENQVYVVGDPDQTIYTWRGADVNIILDFEKDYTPSETIVLNQNYRSTQHILNGANSLIQNNQYRVKKDLFTEIHSDEKVTHCAFTSEDHEANWIAAKLNENKQQGKNFKDMAILYRSNYLSRSLEKAFLDHQIPYVIYGGTRFYDRAEIKDMLSYLRMLTHGDDLAFMRVINQPKRGIGSKTLDKLRDDAKSNKRTMYEEMKVSTEFSGKVLNTFERFAQLIEGCKASLKEKPLLEILERMANDSGLRKMYEEAHEMDRMENIKELINDVITFQNQYPEATLDEYLQMVSLYGDKTDLTTGDYVQLMTIHAAKGLEFDTVYVIGLSDGIFPNERAMSEGRRGLEEERRLAYVAYTRAKRKLYLTEVSGYSFVLMKNRTRSRFIDEIDHKHLDHVGVNYNFDQPKELNLKVKTKEPSPFADAMDKRKALPYKKGEIVYHNVFGEGLIIKIDGGLAEIAFEFPHGLKKIMLATPALSKTKREVS